MTDSQKISGTGSNPKGLGTFAGVFTPRVLAILGINLHGLRLEKPSHARQRREHGAAVGARVPATRAAHQNLPAAAFLGDHAWGYAKTGFDDLGKKVPSSGYLCSDTTHLVMPITH
jgi:hypothetical protein